MCRGPSCTDLFPNPWLDVVCDGYELPFADGALVASGVVRCLSSSARAERISARSAARAGAARAVDSVRAVHQSGELSGVWIAASRAGGVAGTPINLGGIIAAAARLLRGAGQRDAAVFSAGNSGLAGRPGRCFTRGRSAASAICFPADTASRRSIRRVV